uniref:peroxisome proliferator-activated receptor gamma coactivator-related protein 1-like isoform X2 n=1 Tax=Scatophagus argus TaxID=75038 RepID=UPI001ED83ED4|nr:peroxisome proliferator-activated receptor gamma coactivator-related protein 1-like isoform X2 [Scatophagus argus]
MAARWRGKDGDLNAGNIDFQANNTPSELVLCRHHVKGVEVDTQSCMDQSILAIFEDSTVVSEDKSRSEEERETLLSALTEMLDSVEDDDGTPFDTLPDTKLLTQSECRDNSVVGALSTELSLTDRLRPRFKSSNTTFTINTDGEKEDDSKIVKNDPPRLFRQQHQTKAKAEIEVFTSTSLVNLVKIMHPYCLKLHVEEEGDKLRTNHTFFSQEEVWKYERPTEDSDEEINVVSDDEVTVLKTKEETKWVEASSRSALLKSVLLNGNSSRDPPSREKKRVSFGPVQVASFDEPVERGLNEKNATSGHASETVSVPLNSTKALENLAASALEQSSEMSSKKAEVLPPKGETKAKSLSLQQYRQLRQKRQPLVETQENYTTKWPSVSEPPKELTPILCLQGQRLNSCAPKTAHPYTEGRRSGADQLHGSQTPGYKTGRGSAPSRPHPSEAKPSTPKYQRNESKMISPASLLPGVTAHPNVLAPESKINPVKKPTLLSSDPPNPVLLPLSVSQTTSPSTDLSSSESKEEFSIRNSSFDNTRHFQEIEKKTSGASLQQKPSSLGPEHKVRSADQDCTALLLEIQTRFAKTASGISPSSPALRPTTTQIKASSECKELQPQKCCLNSKETKLEPQAPLSPSQVEKETVLDVSLSKSTSEEPVPSLQFGSGGQSATAASGIEAPDLTSLLEQFEETQAKEEGVEPPVEQLRPLSTSDSPGTPKILRNLPHLQMSEAVDIPEPLGTEVILSTQGDLPTRRKNPPSKAIQIIDPRPLPSRKTHSNLSEFPAVLTSPHIYSSISSDHDYCVPVGRSLTHIAQRSRASKLKEISKTTDELQAAARDSSAAAAECKQQTSTAEVNTTITGAVSSSANSAMQNLFDESRSRPETTLSTDKVQSLSDNAPTEQDRGGAAEDKEAPCTLPTPPPSPIGRGRDRRRYRRKSPRSDSSSSSFSSSSSCSSSASRSPKRQKRHHKRSESSSCSSSPSRSISRSISRSPPRRCRWSYSRSRSRSWSQSRSPSRSRSPARRICHRQWRDVYSRDSRRLRREQEIRIQKLKAIDERRVVYVGRICRSMTHDELRERFSQFGEVECVSLHFRERGDHYGFVTFYNMNDAFAAIDNGSKLRRPNELPFDLCFGGRRQFCNSDYADLDANKDTDLSPAKSKFEDLDFDQLLKQAQRGLKR